MQSNNKFEWIKGEAEKRSDTNENIKLEIERNEIIEIDLGRECFYPSIRCDLVTSTLYRAESNMKNR